MKKFTTSAVAILTVLTLILSFCGCAGKKEKDALASYKKTTDSFNKTADFINANKNELSDEKLINTANEIKAELDGFRKKLENEVLKDGEYDKMSKRLGEITEWSKEAKETVKLCMQTNDAYESAVTAYSDLSEYMNESEDAGKSVPYNYFGQLNQYMLKLNSATAQLAPGKDLTNDEYKKLCERFKGIEAWAIETKAELTKKLGKPKKQK